MDIEKIKKNLVQGTPARLLPVLPDARREERATSILLSVFSVVPEFSEAVLHEAGAKVGKRSHTTCFTEVSFRGMDTRSRPDGLIVIQNGKKSWVALVESKVGRSDLSTEQVEEYLDIARNQGFDAVITISNQFASLASHHPVRVNKNKTRSVGLFHFSWTSILAKALLLIDSKRVTDVEQAFLLRELVRYLKDDASGITTPLRLSAAWRDACEEILKGNTLNKHSETATGAVGDWFQLLRYQTIQLTLATGQPCAVKLSRMHESEPERRLSDNVSKLVETQEFTADIQIPNAAADITVTLNFQRRTLTLSASIQAPQDVKQQRAAISFVTQQVKHLADSDLNVRVNWPRRTKATELPIAKALDEYERKNLISESTSDLPTSVELIRLVDLGARIKSSSKVPEEMEAHLETFYGEVVQQLKRHVPKPPRIKEKNSAREKTEEPASVATALSLNSQIDSSQSLTIPSYFFLPPT